MFHSFTKFHRNYIAAAALFLAAKVISKEFVIIAEEIEIYPKFGGILKSQWNFQVEEQPRKLEHVIKVSYVSDVFAHFINLSKWVSLTQRQDYWPLHSSKWLKSALNSA